MLFQFSGIDFGGYGVVEDDSFSTFHKSLVGFRSHHEQKQGTAPASKYGTWNLDLDLLSP